jgi:hypothetical protein
MRLFISAILLGVAETALLAQTPFSAVLGGNLERPPSPPLLTYLSVAAMAAKLATDPSFLPQGPVAKIVFEEYQVKMVGQSQAPTLTRTLTTELDEQGREVVQIDNNASTESKTVATYQNGKILSRDSTSTFQGKPNTEAVWDRWSYAAGHVVDFRRGRGDKLENHYTNMKYDQTGLLTSIEYHPGPSDKLQDRTEYKYSPDGKTIDVVQYDAQGDRLRSHTQVMDDQGRVIRVEINEKDWKTKQWKPPLRVGFRYDAAGRLVEQTSEPHAVGPGSEFEVPPGKITLVYDDAKHTRDISYVEGTERLNSTVHFDGTGAIVAMRMSTDGDAGNAIQVELECSYDDHANWTECRRWARLGEQRRMNGLWRRRLTYR